MNDDTSGSGTHGTHEGMSRRQALGYGGLATAGIVAGQMAASSAASAAEGGSLAARTISLAQAKRIVRAGVRYVRRTPGIPPMYILVADSAGDVKASERMDGNGPASTALVPIKAHTSRSFRAATVDLAARYHRPGPDRVLHHSRLQPARRRPTDLRGRPADRRDRCRRGIAGAGRRGRGRGAQGPLTAHTSPRERSSSSNPDPSGAATTGTVGTARSADVTSAGTTVP